MKKYRNNILVILFVLSFLVGLGYGCYLLLLEAINYSSQLNPELVSILTIVLFSAIYVGISIRRAAYLNGIKRTQLESKIRHYERFIKVCYYRQASNTDINLDGTDSRDELAEVCAQLMIWAGPEIVRQLGALKKNNPNWMQDPARARNAIKPIIHAMRKDLGQNNLRLKISDLDCE